MKVSKVFERGANDNGFPELAEFCEKRDFSCSDMLAVVCDKLAGLPQKEFTTELMVAGVVWNITLTKKENELWTKD